ncbi:MDR family MFS transporter [Aspergillus ibericus CBS 121593]|uniref:MFS general substrate transporter n=1 Tax=Aspergillus ibericus CBS 121593 TaxID=1448316 RepID=A0A395H7U5_9EURO|nr:MFS general substrate transporter [Aspergillus ibericus CBS 121593]RAL03639.1 MFS general substrate transporter [Aspergillus ibericus CBS 121593]
MALASAKDSGGAAQQPIEMSENGQDQCGSENIVSNTPDLERVLSHQVPESGSEIPEARSNWKVFATMIALSLALFISALDQTIVATATPTISSDLHSASGYVWIGGAYLLANAASSNIWANLSDIWGRKPILLTAVALFFVASIICATANGMPMLITGRGIQGIAGGGLIQLITITISDLFSVRLRSLFLGLIEFIWAIAGALGPIVGGAFTQSVSWRWIFWINLPVCGTAFVLLYAFLDIHNPKTPVLAGIKAVDWWGSFSMLALIVLLLLGLDFGGDTFPWGSPKVICLIVFGCLMSFAFIYSEKSLAKYPLMPLGVFRKRSNVACFLVDFTHGFAYLGAEYYLPLYFQSAKEASPFRSGVLILPFVLTEAAFSLFSGLVIHRTGRYLEIIWAGTALVVLGTGLFTNYSATSTIGKIVGYQITAGMGCGMLFFPPLLALQSNVSQASTASATATFGFIRNVAMAMSVVLGGVVFQNSMDMQQGSLSAAGLSSSLLKEFSGTEAAANVNAVRSVQDPTQRRAVADAYAWSLRNMWILYAAMAACGFVASAFITRQHLSDEHVETKTGLKEKQPEPEQ